MLSDQQWQLPNEPHPRLVPLPPALYSLLRFSMPQQQWGTSEHRQAGYSKDYCAARGWPDPFALTVQGSAFYGDHRAEETAFGQFLALVFEGKIPIGTVLLVEALDRFSREHPMEAVTQIWALIKKGIEIHVTHPDHEQIYNTKTCKKQRVINELVDDLMRAHGESVRKQELILDSKRIARERAITKGDPIPGKIKPWLKLVGHNKRLYKLSEGEEGGGKYVLRDGKQYNAKGNLLYGTDGKPLYDPKDDRAAIMLRIWTEHKDVGGLTITQRLIAEGVPCWGKSGTWSKPTIEDLLTDEAVIGTRVFYKRERVERADGKLVRKKTIDYRKFDYYPAVIPRELYDEVRAARADRVENWRGQTGVVKGKREFKTPYPNLVKHICHCAHCKHPLKYVDHRREREIKTGSIRPYDIMTPKGLFLSAAQAARSYRITRRTAGHYARDNLHGWSLVERVPKLWGSPHLICSYGSIGRGGCTNRATYDYPVLEKQLFEFIAGMARNEDHEEVVPDNADLIAELEAAIADIQQRRVKFVAAFAKNPDLRSHPDIQAETAAFITGEQNLSHQLEAERRKIAKAPHSLDEVGETYRRSLEAPAEKLGMLRARLAREMRSAIESVVLNSDQEIVATARPIDYNGTQTQASTTLTMPDTDQPPVYDVAEIARQCQDIFSQHDGDRILLAELTKKLNEIEHRPWLRSGKHRLPVILKSAFNIELLNLYGGRGYRRCQFTEEALMNEQAQYRPRKLGPYQPRQSKQPEAGWRTDKDGFMWRDDWK